MGISKDKIMHIASTSDGFYVDKYSWGAAALRKKCRKMAKEGKLIFAGVCGTLLIYKRQKEVNHGSTKIAD